MASPSELTEEQKREIAAEFLIHMGERPGSMGVYCGDGDPLTNAPAGSMYIDTESSAMWVHTGAKWARILAM